MRILRLVLLAVLLVHPKGARAAPDPYARGIDPVATKLSPFFDAYLTADGSGDGLRGSRKLELALDVASGLLAWQTGQTKNGDLIRSRFDLHLMGAYAVRDWLEVGVDLPLTLYQATGFADLQNATGFQDPGGIPGSAGLGGIRALGKFRLLEQGRSPVALSAIAEVRLPTGAASRFLGERGLYLAPRAVAERRFLQRLLVALEVGYGYRTSPGSYLNLVVGDELTGSLAAAFEAPEQWIRLSWLKRWTLYGELLVATPARAPFTTSASDALKTPLEALLGLRAALSHDLEVTLGGGTGLAGRSGFGRESLRLFASLRWARVIRDRDRDGVPDELDRCPDVPGPASNDGCPEAGRELDRDHDGVPDTEDRCPDLPGPKELDGCPDRDGDEVPDIDDKCPDEPGPAKNDGCPVIGVQVVFEQHKLTLKGSVTFEFGKATLKKESDALLNEVVAVLKGHPEVARVRVEGHTDNVGGADFNLDLSRRRAESVVRYVVSHGVEAKRLAPEGYGLTRPLLPNTTALSRAKNRRVEFTVLE
jgi:outer membrane protein OmpA-like peptidoglycan-associated protein